MDLQTPIARGLAALALALAVAGAGRPALAEDPPPSAFELGATYFDEAVSYVARGGAIGKTRDLYVHLADVQWDLDTADGKPAHQEGEESVWFVSPDRLRTTLTGLGKSSTKILDGDKAWTVDHAGKAHRLHATPGAEAEIGQLKEDLLRVRDLTDFLTLEGLKGPGVSFEFLGRVQGTKAYAGNWLKVLRRSPDDRRITFWLAYTTDAAGKDHATWPGVVRVDGDAKAGLHTEDWILKDWDSPQAKPRPFRYPSRIEAWQINPDPEAAKTDPPKRFLLAFLDDIQLNAGIEPAQFAPPATTGTTPPGQPK